MNETPSLEYLTGQLNQVLANQERHDEAYRQIIDMLSRMVALEERQINLSGCLKRFGDRLDDQEQRLRSIERIIDRRTSLYLWAERGLMVGFGYTLAKALGLTWGQ